MVIELIAKILNHYKSSMMKEISKYWKHYLKNKIDNSEISDILMINLISYLNKCSLNRKVLQAAMKAKK